MATQKIDRETRKALMDARALIEGVIKADLNEAETGRRIEHLFSTLMGYDIFKNITREHAVHAVGDSNYCDLAIQVDEEKRTPVIMVEIKKANIDLCAKHLKQAASYAIDSGCEWALLTNGKCWQLYHISFGQPPQTVLLDSWDLLENDIEVLADKFNLICHRNIKKGGLKQLWEKSNVLTAENMLKVLLSEESLAMVRRNLKKMTDVNVTPDEIVGAIRHLLNEAALNEMAKIKICLPGKKPVKKPAASPVKIETQSSSGSESSPAGGANN